ncbi:MAG: Ig-like domain-containing protein, partial [Lachnospiraceae bacterium]|nr:Ig-like domain-containing protein [Lachnospiraceae bacterium]
MNKNLRKMMACLLTAAEVLTLMPVNAAAAQDTDIQLSIDSGITVDPGITIDDSIPVITSESADKENVTELLSDNEEDDQAVTGTGSITMSTEWHDDGQTGSDELLEGYLNQLVEENKTEGKKHIEPEGIARGELLDEDINKYMYDFLVPNIKKVADGSLSSSEFSTGTVNMSDIGVTKTTFTKEELGVSDFNSQENRKKALSKLIADSGFSTSKIMNALLEDLPYDLYWYDKTGSGAVSFLYGCRFSYSESSISVSDLYFVIKFYVSKEYSSTGAFETTDINTQKTGAAKAAVTKAKAVVADAITAGNNTDYKKMQYYKDYICENVSYNDDALEEGTPYGNPWQLIWVFDDDPNTKVVCEGYSKAFKLLCDLSDFDYSDADCYLVSGTMSGQGGSGAGAHMWNVVHMDDVKNYLVDVTNCDTGFSLFLAGYKSQITNGYVVDGLTYTYDSNTLRDFSLSERTINSIDYKESQTLIDISGATVTLGNSLTYNGQIQSQTVSRVTVNGTDLSSSDYTVSNSTGKNAGNYTLTVTARTGSAYTGSVTKGFTIGKKAVNPTVTVTGSYTYTGSAIEPTYTVKDGSTSLATSDYTASLSDNTNAGTGKITVSATSGGNYSFSPVTQTFTINKASAITLEDISIEQTYTGTSVSSLVAGKMPSDAGTVSYTKGNPSVVGSATVSSFGVTTAGNVNATFSNGKAGDVITLPVTISSTNYNDSIIKVVVTLKAKSSANVSISGSSSVTKTYGDGSFTLSASALNKGSGQGIWTWSSSNTNTATVTNTSGTGTVTIKGVGQSTIKAHYESDTTVGEASVTLTVNKKTLTLTWNDTSFTYDGSAHKPTATLSGVKSGDVCTVSVSGEQTNAGTYTATASLSGAASGNYALQNNQKTCSFTINKASISGAAVTLGTELTYTGSEQTQTVSKVTVNGKELASTDYTVTNNKGTNAGSYNLTVTAAGNNYTGSKTQAFIISKKSITPTVTISGTYTFTGSAITPSYTVKDGSTSLATGDYTVSLSDNTNAGTGKITVSATSGGNYSFSPVTQTFTINKASAGTLEDISIEQTYTGTSVSASVAGKMPSDAGTLRYTAGTATITKVSGSTTSVSNFTVDDKGIISAVVTNGTAGDVITLPVTISSINYADSTVNVVVTLLAKSDAAVTINGSSSVTKTYGDSGFTLNASAAVPGTGTGKWTWESSNANVATVAGSGTTGTITIKGVGQSILKAHYESDTTVGEASVTLNVGMKTLELNWSNTSFTYDGAPHKPTATVTGVISGDDCTVSVSGEQTEAGTHTATASLTGAASGNYALQDDQKTCAFTISKIKVSNLNITGAVNPVSIRKGDEIQLGVMVTPSYASDKTVKWSSSNTNAVTVNSTGLVTAAAIGTAVITAEANDGSGVSATLDITVFDDNDMLYVEFADGLDYIYTGKPVTPLIRVYNRGRLLMQETDYTVKYSNNVNANDGSNEKKAPKAVVTGKTVAATAEAVFHIYRKDIGDETSVLAEEVNISSGKTAAPLLYYGGTKLGTKDFTNPDAKTKFT